MYYKTCNEFFSTIIVVCCQLYDNKKEALFIGGTIYGILFEVICVLICNLIHMDGICVL